MAPADAQRPSSSPDTSSTKGALTRQAVLAAAIVRFGRDGYRATSVADIARDAAVSGTAPYAYFPGKAALFTAALDEDAAGVIGDAVTTMLDDPAARAWSPPLMGTLITSLVASLEHHPLARRVLAGLEPHATAHMVEIPALDELRKAVADRLRTDQFGGTVRPDVDPTAMANGAVAIVISLLMSIIQFGDEGLRTQGADVLAIFEAAFAPIPPPT